MKNTYKKLQNSHFCVATVVVMLAVWCCSATEAPIFFTDRASFDTATGGGLSFESFEHDFAVFSTIVFSGFTVCETSGINNLGQLRDFPGVVDGAITHGTGGLFYDDNGSSIGTFFSFTSPITAFGLDIATNPGSTMTIGGSVSDTLVLATDTPSFWGVIYTAGINSISFRASGAPNVGFDAVSYSVPEPVTIEATIDIKPGSCPNPLNVKSKGVLPVAILGSADFDVHDINVATIQLAGVDPNRSNYENVARPLVDADGCECSTEEPDVYMDLTLKFNAQEIVGAIGPVADGDELVLELTGLLHDGTPITGADCIIIRAKGKK